MKLATYKDGSRDGHLVVVSRDLSLAHHASGIASRLQQVLDDWNFLSPQLEELSQTLNHGKARHAFAFDPRQCMAPLPRAYQWLDGSAYRYHLELLRRSRGAEPPAASQPLIYQGGSDDFLGACDPVVARSVADGIDFEAEVAVVTGDVPMGASPDTALEAVRLLMLANDVTLRSLAADDLAGGFGFVLSKPSTAFAPVAVTPDELAGAWRDGRLYLPVQVRRNGGPVGRCPAGDEMTFHFGELIAHVCQTRRMRAGSIVGGGAVTSRDPADGDGCIAHRRAIETLEGDTELTAYLRDGDTVHIEVLAADGTSVFGAIDQRVAAPG